MNKDKQIVTDSKGKKYQLSNDTAYHEETPEQVISWLETARQRKQRIRIFLGDTKTGRDWMEEYETMGTVGRSTGTIKIPLIISTSRSMGGGGILDHCIVKITVDKKVVYQHPKYHLPKLDIRPTKDEEAKNKGLAFEVVADGKPHARFETKEKAKQWMEYIAGKTNKK